MFGRVDTGKGYIHLYERASTFSSWPDIILMVRSSVVVYTVYTSSMRPNHGTQRLPNDDDDDEYERDEEQTSQ